MYESLKTSLGEGIRSTSDLKQLGLLVIDSSSPLHPAYLKEFDIGGFPFSSVLHYVYSQFLLGFGLNQQCTIDWRYSPTQRFQEFTTLALSHGWISQDDLDLFDKELWCSCVETAYKAKIAQDEEFSNQFKQIGQLVPVVVGKSESDIGVGMSSPELNEWMSASGYSAAEVLSWSVGPTTSRPREIGANRVGQILYRLNEKSINDARNSRQLRLEHDYASIDEFPEDSEVQIIDPICFLNTCEYEPVKNEEIKVDKALPVPTIMVEGENLADVRPEAKAKAEVSPARMEQTDSESESELLQPTAEQVQNLSEDTDEPAKSAELVNSETSDDSDEEDYLDGSTLEPYWIENPNDCLHDWHRCPFTDEGVTYQTVRQFVHYHLLMRLGWEYSFFADASLQSLQLILSANSPAECTSKTAELLDLFCQQTGLMREAMGVERHLRPLLHKAYRLKLSAWPQIRQSLVDTTARVIVRLDETNREDLWCRLLSSGLNCDSMSNVTQEELRRLFHDSTSHSNRRGRNLVGGVLMKLRELLGVQAAFLSTGVRHSLEKRAIFSSGASSFEEFCVTQMLINLGLYDGPLENNSRELRTAHGNPVELESLIEAIMQRNSQLEAKMAHWISGCLYDCLLRAAQVKFSSDHTWRDRILGTGHRLLVCLPVGLKSLPVDIRLTSEEFLDFVDRTKLTGAELIEQMREKKIGGNVWGLALMQIREVFIEEREVSRKRQEEEEEKIRKEMEAREEQMRIQLEEQRREDERRLKELVEESVKAEIKRLDERKSCGEEQGESENVPVSTKDSRELVVDKMARKIVVKKKLVEQPVPDICGAETDGVAQPVIDRSQKKIVIRRQNVDSSIGSGSGQSTTKLSALERLKSLNFTSKFSFGEKPVVSSNGDQSRLQRSPVGKSRNRSDLVGSVGETELVSTADYRIYPKRPKFEGPQVRGAFPLQDFKVKEKIDNLNISKVELDQMSEKQLETLMLVLRDKQSGADQQRELNSAESHVEGMNEIVGNPVIYRPLWTPFD